MSRVLQRKITEEWVEVAEAGEDLSDTYSDDDPEPGDEPDRDSIVEEKAPRRRRAAR